MRRTGTSTRAARNLEHCNAASGVTRHPDTADLRKGVSACNETEKPIIEMRGIDKHYGGVHAVRSVDLDIYSGEVHALVGDNAAGKSTLIKIFSGAVAKDGGTISFDGRPWRSTSHAMPSSSGSRLSIRTSRLADNLDVAVQHFPRA